jgi:hypothetical protein
MPPSELTVGVSDSVVFRPDDIVPPQKFHQFKAWAADQCEKQGRHPAFDYVPGFDFHLARLEDAVGETIDASYQPRFPELRVRDLIKAVRRHIRALRDTWDNPAADQTYTAGSSALLIEARRWTVLRRYPGAPGRKVDRGPYAGGRDRGSPRGRAHGRHSRSSRAKARAPGSRSSDDDPHPERDLVGSPGGAR